MPPHAAPDFSLRDQNGQPFMLSSLRGSGTALYFGFTHCKDVCPETLAMLGKARARAGLPPDRFRIVMVTVDPRRDSPAAMRAFFKRAGVAATGVTGSPAAIHASERAYGVFVRREGSDIAHTDQVFLIGPDGRLYELLDPQTPLNDIASDMRAVVE